MIALNGPESQTKATIREFEKLFLGPGFLAFGSILIVLSLGLIFWAGPRYGKKNMLVYVREFELISVVTARVRLIAHPQPPDFNLLHDWRFISRLY